MPMPMPMPMPIRICLCPCHGPGPCPAPCAGAAGPSAGGPGWPSTETPEEPQRGLRMPSTWGEAWARLMAWA